MLMCFGYLIYIKIVKLLLLDVHSNFNWGEIKLILRNLYKE